MSETRTVEADPPPAVSFTLMLPSSCGRVSVGGRSGVIYRRRAYLDRYGSDPRRFREGHEAADEAPAGVQRHLVAALVAGEDERDEAVLLDEVPRVRVGQEGLLAGGAVVGLGPWRELGGVEGRAAIRVRRVLGNRYPRDVADGAVGVGVRHGGWGGRGCGRGRGRGRGRRDVAGGYKTIRGGGTSAHRGDASRGTRAEPVDG